MRTLLQSPLLLAALGAGWLAAPAVAWFAGLGAADTSLQNRSLADVPALTLAGAADGTWSKAFESAVWDRLPFRAALLRAEHTVAVRVFGDSPVPGAVVVGADDFQFLKDRAVGRQGGAVDVRRLERALDRIEGAFDAAGVPLRIVVSPNKAATHKDQMPPGLRAVFDATVQPVVTALERRARRDTHLVSLGPIFRGEAKRRARAPAADPRRVPLFRAHDLHWNVELGQLQARAIVNAIAEGQWNNACAPALTRRFVEAEPELMTLFTKVGPTEPYQGIKLSPRVQLSRVRTGVQKAVRFTTQSECPTRPLRLLVIRDSFLSAADDGSPRPARDGGIEAIAGFFQESTFVHWEALTAQPKKVAGLAANADAVVIQVVLGNVGALITHDKKLIALAARQADTPR